MSNGVKTIGVLGPDKKPICFQIRKDVKAALQKHAERVGCSAELLIRTEMSAYAKSKAQPSKEPHRRPDLGGVKTDTTQLIVTCSAELDSVFRAAIKRRKDKMSTVLRACIDKILENPQAA